MRRIGLFGLVIVLLGTVVFPAFGDAGPNLTVDVSAPTHPISPYIYGMNFADPALAAEIGLPLNRWGGNDTSRYDYSIDTSSKGMDYFFANIPYRIEDGEPARPLPDQSNVFRYIRQNQTWGGDTIVTVPMMGWMPKDEAYRCSYTRAAYPNQTAFDPWHDCGNGKNPGNVLITDNDELVASRVVNESFVTTYITDLVAEFGAGSSGGVKFYNLDNEPMLWNETHRDVRKQPLGYDELVSRGISYGEAVKAVDPSALLLGPVGFGPTEYFYSALDWTQPGNWWENAFDRAAHGGKPLAEWYLEQMAAYDAVPGHGRLLDYFDEHYYPQGDNVSLTEDVDAGTSALRLRSTRSLWDPTYTDESWVAQTESAQLMLIPRMKAWVDENYPGTKLAITEYNWGGLKHLNGALAQADVLGIFGREGLDLAALWAPPDPSDPGAYAFRMYLNYDGAGAQFGDVSVSSASDNQGQVAIYGATRTSDGALTLMVINKSNADRTSNITIAGYDTSPIVEVWQYSGDDLHAIQERPAELIAAGTMTHTFPASSITLLVLTPPAGPSTDIVANGSFEDGLASWTMTNKTSDKVKCNALEPLKVASIGNCGLMLSGTSGTTTKVRQVLETIVGIAGDNAILTAWSKTKGLAAAVQLKATLTTTAGTQTLKFKVTKGTHDWQAGISLDTLLGDLVSGTVDIIIKSGTGKAYIDDVELNINSAVRAVLPPPQAPSGFRR